MSLGLITLGEEMEGRKIGKKKSPIVQDRLYKEPLVDALETDEIQSFFVAFL